MDKGAVFRKLHEAPGAFVIPNPWDIGTAKLLAASGFKALATTSAGFAFSRGLPDGGVPFDVMIAHCKELSGATDLPVSADLEKGKGDSPESAAETIFAAEAAGLAGCSIEDFSGDPAKPVYEFSHAVERVTAAVEAARALRHDFVFTARAENFLRDNPDLDDTIARLQAFERAGADVLYAPGITDIETVRKICSAVSKPVNVLVVPGITDIETVRKICSAVSKPVNVLVVPGFTVDGLAQAGAKRISLGSKLTTYAFGMLQKASREMLDNGTFEFSRDGMAFGALQTMFSTADA